MTDQEKIEVAWRKKEEGNLLFKEGKYQRARKKYDRVVGHSSLLKLQSVGIHVYRL